MLTTKLQCLKCKELFWPTAPFLCKEVPDSFLFCKSCSTAQRNKREDLDCKCKDLEYLLDTYETYNVVYYDEKSVNIMKTLLQESKMRCSKHCGNTVRDK